MIDAVPPALLHALVCDKSGKRRLPLSVIVARSGLTERTYLRTARRPSWDDVKWKVIKAMILGTGINPMAMRKSRQKLRKHGFKIKTLTPRQQKNLDEACQRKLEASNGPNVPAKS